MHHLLTVGLVQMTSSTDVDENVETASRLIEDAAARGAALVATPEMTSFLERSRTRALAGAAGEENDRALAAFRSLAERLGIHLLIGSIPIRLAEDKLANRCFLLGPDGRIRARYDKIHLFDVALGAHEVYRESDLYEGGRKAVLVETPLASLGLTICYDLRFPYLYRSLARAGAQILMVPAAFTAVTGRAHWHILLRARAIETGCFVLAPAQVGHHADGRDTFGHTLAVGPWGEVLADGGEEVGVTLLELDLAAVDEARRRVPALEHDRRIEVERLRADPASEEEIDDRLRSRL